jgi:hypothetical protein
LLSAGRELGSPGGQLTRTGRELLGTGVDRRGASRELARALCRGGNTARQWHGLFGQLSVAVGNLARSGRERLDRVPDLYGVRRTFALVASILAAVALNSRAALASCWRNCSVPPFALHWFASFWNLTASVLADGTASSAAITRFANGTTVEAIL